ncbi:hypothetical protein MSAN_02032200 [Mycena sanguinolenta]|uniref:Uncharacterized protein n=1 Tax=Mycena sanguinolenta TaxID=230812 RepID=A0A8H6XIP2_9AGAR|nr:hypothetical protein MSAN_02032200 [Mycena sanguinolenta]
MAITDSGLSMVPGGHLMWVTFKMFSKFFVVTSLALLAVCDPAATKTHTTATHTFTVAVPLGLGPKNAIFNAGIIGSDAKGTTITYGLAEDVIETVTATINSKSLIEVQEGETEICTPHQVGQKRLVHVLRPHWLGHPSFNNYPHPWTNSCLK